MKQRFLTYCRVWYLTSSNALQQAFVNRYTNSLFFTGKVIRFAMTLLVLYLIKKNIDSFAGYSSDELIIFFLSYQFIDSLAQVFYRGTYLISNAIRSGNFDFLLVKPISPLFQALTGQPDFNDAIFIVPATLISIWIALQLDLNITLASFIWYLVLLANAFLIATALHILVIAVGIITTEIDHAVWIYRDFLQLGRYPVTIYLAPLKFALFFIIPIGMMITIPSEVLLNSPPTYSKLFAIFYGAFFFIASLKIWKVCLKHYSSASS
jgi:ABC-2 type transport system permease protein